MIKTYPLKRKGFTFKTLLVRKDGSSYVISQDSRRKRNVITGVIRVYKPNGFPMNCWNAKSLGCSIIVKEK